MFFSTLIYISVQRDCTTPYTSLEVSQWVSENYPGCGIALGLQTLVFLRAGKQVSQVRLENLNLLSAGMYENHVPCDYCG
jgi:hypothetical protein